MTFSFGIQVVLVIFMRIGFFERLTCYLKKILDSLSSCTKHRKIKFCFQEVPKSVSPKSTPKYFLPKDSSKRLPAYIAMKKACFYSNDLIKSYFSDCNKCLKSRQVQILDTVTTSSFQRVQILDTLD